MKLSKRTTKRIKSPSARTENQKTYVKAILDNDIVICEGPAGTGKTHLAIGLAIFAFKRELVDRIVIVRPVVEAGEQIGFLPGDIDSKMDPFVRPIFDELAEYTTPMEVEEMRKNKQLEIVPIAFMRGRTFKNAFIVCDECQNLGFEQMKMMLTRFGTDSKMILTGDTKQSDLLMRDRGAFRYACEVFGSQEGIQVVKLDHSDVQRHNLVGKMTKLWEKHLDNFKNQGTIR